MVHEQLVLQQNKLRKLLNQLVLLVEMLLYLAQGTTNNIAQGCLDLALEHHNLLTNLKILIDSVNLINRVR
uniref:Uncharacterized protein n=1 Tax=Picea glauca TaxID=3330 RepID=A0A117NFJ4_PICGL|nr:hypothetical protein ABT39_MTgene3425 [Picea glauca]